MKALTLPLIGMAITFLSAVAAFGYGMIRILVLYSRGTLRRGMSANERMDVIIREMKPVYILGAVFMIGVFTMLTASFLGWY